MQILADDRPRLNQLDCIEISGERVRIVQKLSVDWQRLATFLGFDHSVLTTIEYDYPHMTEKACEEMFRRWLNGEAGGVITWGHLIEALKDAERSELAKTIQKWLI